MVVLALVTSCKVKQTSQQTAVMSETKSMPGPHAIVYRTKADYSRYVPVTLAEDRSQIVSYPAPTDVYRNGKLATPTVLTGGYLLDNRGINDHSAFLPISYEQYAQYKDLPSLADMYRQITDKKPFEEMYDLGLRNKYTNEIEEINAIIRSGKLKDYKRIL